MEKLLLFRGVIRGMEELGAELIKYSPPLFPGDRIYFLIKKDSEFGKDLLTDDSKKLKKASIIFKK